MLQRNRKRTPCDNRESLRLVVDLAPDAMIVINRESEIVLANVQAATLFGWEPGEITGQKLEALIPQRYRQRHVEHEAKFFAHPFTRPVHSGLELFGLRKDGTEFPVEISLSPINAGKDQLVASAIRDITERKRAEREIAELNAALRHRAAQLEESNKELEAFSYSVSHDLRAPLRHIQGFVDRLKKTAGPRLDKSATECLQVISTAAGQMGQLIDDLLGFSRMGRTEMQTRPVDLEAVTRSVIDEIRGEAKHRRIVWKNGGLPRVQGDSSMLRQVMVNLISNAVKYTRPREVAEIEIGSSVEGGEHVVFVRDNGVGFEMEYAHKLFGVFQRLHHINEFEGSGIGLANVRRIIHRHGGRTWAEGKLDGGATFYFSLPHNPSVAS